MSKSQTQPSDTLLREIELVALDVEGILTDGRKQYSADGFIGLNFNARDGLGIELLQRAGLTVAIISTTMSSIVRSRAFDLGIEHIFLGIEDKRTALRSLREHLGMTKEKTLYAGDDLWDLMAFDEAAVRATVPDAPAAVREMANWVTQNRGGYGAAREISDELLRAKEIDPLELLQTVNSEGMRVERANHELYDNQRKKIGGEANESSGL